MGIVFCIVGVALCAEDGAASGSVRVRRLLQIARGGRTRDRVEAINDLGALSDRQLIDSFKVPDVLADLARDDGDNPRVRKEAIDALVGLTTDVDPALKLKTKAILVKMAKDSDQHIVLRLRSAEGLGKILKKDAIEDHSDTEALAGVAANTREPAQLRAAAMLSLAEIGKEKYADLARKLVSDSDPIVRDAGLEALGMLFKTDASESSMLPLLWTIAEETDTEAGERIKVLKTICRISGQGMKSKTAGPKIVKLLRDEKDEEFLLVVVEVASMYAEPSAVVHIQNFYGTLSGKEKSRVRAEVCYLLGDMLEQFGRRVDFRMVSRAAQQVATLLVDALKNDDSPEVAKASAFALGQMYSRKFDRKVAVKELIDTVEHDPEDQVRETAGDSLSMITGRDFGDDIEKWRNWYGKNAKDLGAGVR